MGFKQREKRRKAQAAQARAQSWARREGTSAGKWWLTIASKTTCCALCGQVLREGKEMVYRHTPREARCLRCATGDPVSAGYRCSLRWEQWKKNKIRQATRPAGPSPNPVPSSLTTRLGRSSQLSSSTDDRANRKAA